VNGLGSGARRGYRHTRLTVATLPMRGRWCAAHPTSSRRPSLPTAAHASLRSYPRRHLYPSPSQPPVLPTPHIDLRCQFLRFPDHGGGLGVRLAVSATHMVGGKPLNPIGVQSVSRTTIKVKVVCYCCPLVDIVHVRTTTAPQRVPNGRPCSLAEAFSGTRTHSPYILLRTRLTHV
jgi:hypothetical protein